MRTITKLRRNSKALSPIFATLILIAIAVIAGIVVYMFTSGTIAGLTSGGAAGQEKAAVQGVQITATGIDVYASCTDGGPIVVTGALVKNSTGQYLFTPAAANAALGTDGQLETLSFADPASFTGWTIDSSYTVTLTSTNGGSFVSSSFKP